MDRLDRMVLARKIHGQPGQSRPILEYAEAVDKFAIVRIFPRGIDILIHRIEHPSDEKRLPDDPGVIFRNDRLDIVEGKARPGGGEVKVEFHGFHTAVSFVTSVFRT